MGSADVSVIVPAYNAERYIASAVESVLQQTLPARDIIVVDDGSSDGTRHVVEQYGDRVRYVYQQNRGVAAARNRGIEISRSRYVGFLDADDTWFPDKLEKQIGALQHAPEYRACYTAHLIVNDRLEPLYVNRSERHGTALEDLLMAGNVVGSPTTVLCERELFDAVGGFDMAFSLCADWEMWLRISRSTDFLYLDEPLVRYRVHDENMSRDVARLERESTATIEKGFAMPGLQPSLRSRRRPSLAHNYMVLAGSYLRAHCFRDAARCTASAVARDPRQMKQIFSFVHRLARGRTGQRGVTQTNFETD